MEIIKVLNPTNEIIQKNDDNGLQLCKITVNEDYAKKWNVDLNDFLALVKNGELVTNNLYRIGGINNPNLQKDNYFMLLKYSEAFYGDDIIKITKSDPKHLKGNWVIIDKNGVEKFENKSIKPMYLVKNSCVFSLDNKYYNIETGNLYCDSYSKMESEDFVFLDNAYDKDKLKRGILKINKKDGTYELFPKK